MRIERDVYWNKKTGQGSITLPKKIVGQPKRVFIEVVKKKRRLW